MILLLRLTLAALLLVSWQVASSWRSLDFFISRPTDILAVMAKWAADGSLMFHLGITALEAGAGFTIGALVGIGLGLILGRSRLLADVLEPFLTAFYSLPKAALAPLFILWFGIGIEMKIILTAAVVFFLVFLNTYTGVREVSQDQIATLRLMGAEERHLLTKVVVPSALVWVFTGLASVGTLRTDWRDRRRDHRLQPGPRLSTVKLGLAVRYCGCLCQSVRDHGLVPHAESAS